MPFAHSFDYVSQQYAKLIQPIGILIAQAEVLMTSSSHSLSHLFNWHTAITRYENISWSKKRWPQKQNAKEQNLAANLTRPRYSRNFITVRVLLQLRNKRWNITAQQMLPFEPNSNGSRFQELWSFALSYPSTAASQLGFYSNKAIFFGPLVDDT